MRWLEEFTVQMAILTSGRDNMTLKEKQERFITDFNELGDWFMQYEYLIALAGEKTTFKEAEKKEETRIKSCQSNVWVLLDYDGQRISVRADSDSLIIRGILGIIEQLLDGRTPEEIAAADINFIERTALKQQLLTDRFKGMVSVITKIKTFAAERSESRKTWKNM